jgi:hypothetical protein
MPEPTADLNEVLTLLRTSIHPAAMAGNRLREALALVAGLEPEGQHLEAALRLAKAANVATSRAMAALRRRLQEEALGDGEDCEGR